MSAFKTAKKKILRSTAVRGAACWLVAQYIRLVWYTGRWTVMGSENFAGVWDKGEAGIVAFWHGRLLMMPYAWKRPKPFRMLTSAHRDGELIAATVKQHGIGSIIGSTAKDGRDKGGSNALRAMLKALKSGAFIGMTPDGPRGPRMRASDGIINVARLSGAPILPLTFSVSSGRVLGTWDRFLLPLPFSRGVLYWGEPLYVSRKLDDAGIDAARATLEARLNTMTEEADRRMNRAVIAPSEDVWKPDS